MSGRPRRSEQGSATVLVLACVLAGCFVCGLWVQAARGGLARQRAETAADLAALAAAAAINKPTVGLPCLAATRVATSNHARLESCRIDAAGGVEIVVSVDSPISARSRAHAGQVVP